MTDDTKTGADVWRILRKPPADMEWQTNYVDCETCSGEGAVMAFEDLMPSEIWIDCPDCDGLGTVPR